MIMSSRLLYYRSRLVVVVHLMLVCLTVSSANKHKASFKNPAKLHCPEPIYCHCSGHPGNIKVFCGKNITYIPVLPPDTRHLSMEHAYLNNINIDTFSNLTNITLRYLGLVNCGLRNVSRDAFQRLLFKHIATLSLSYNQIPSEELREIICNLPIVNVTKLRLDGMSLTTLPPGFFECLSKTSITELSLKHNGISSISRNTTIVSKLVALFLDYNALKSIELMNFKSLLRLGLSFNQLVQIPAFTDTHGNSVCPKLTALYLEHNTGLMDIRSSNFKGLKSLAVLRLMFSNTRKLANNLLTEMPMLKSINLEHSNIRDISKDTFNSTSVRHIDLSQNRLGELPSWDIFSGCPNLRTLILSNNDFYWIGDSHFADLFRPLKKLERLYLQHTRLQNVPVNLFKNLPSLINLFLSGNLISHWNSTVFSKARNIEKLYLDTNLITGVNETSFPTDYMQRLKTLNLGRNPFICTCHLLWFRNWLNQTNITIVGLQNRLDYKCNSPRNWRGKPLLEFRPTIAGCTPINLYLILGASLGTLAVVIVVITVMIIKYKMHIRYFVFLIRSRMKRYTQLDEVNNYEFDAFVVYSSQDREWVLRELLPRVEYQEGYKLSLYDRDFIPGRDIVDNVIEHMESSRMVIVVLSDNFAESHWCKWELTMAQNKLMDQQKDILVLVKLDEIRPEHMTNRLMLLMRDKVYIDWSDCVLGRELFWKRLVSALARPLNPVNI